MSDNYTEVDYNQTEDLYDNLVYAVDSIYISERSTIPSSTSQAMKALTDSYDEFYKDVADKVFKQFAEGKINPVLIINAYEDEQMHKKVARIFNSELNSELNDKEREKALNEIVINIKLNSIRNKQSTTTDLNEYQMLMNLEEEIKNISIKL